MSWKVEADFSSASELNAPPPREDGVYKVRIGPSELTTTGNGRQRVRWTNIVTDGPYAGCGIWDGLMLPNTGVEKSDKFFRDQWFTLGRALGIAAAKLHKLKTLSPKLIEGKEMYVKFVSAKVQGAYNEVSHLPSNLVEAAQHAMALNTSVTEDLSNDDDLAVDTGSAPVVAPETDDLDDLFA